MSRETKLTTQLQDTICKYVQGGATLPHACAAAGISWNTVKDWAKPGYVEREPYASFAAAVEEAKARWAAGAAMQITSHGKKDWKALAWMLERRNPGEYSVASKHEHSGPDGGAIKIDHYAKMTDAQLLAAAMGDVASIADTQAKSLSADMEDE